MAVGMAFHVIASSGAADGARPGLSGVSLDLPFSPVRLIGLMVWAYLCLYMVQQVDFSNLIPKQWKTVTKLCTFLLGPLPLGAVALRRWLTKPRESRPAPWQSTVKAVAAAVTSLRRRSSPQAEVPVLLLDTAGRTIDEVYGHGDGERQDNRILNLTGQIIADALQRRASDILIDPEDETAYTVRLRIDGVLRTVQVINAGTCKAVINSIKAVSNMDIAEKRRPQDGAFLAKKGDISASFRVASAGVVNGEKLAVRILSQKAGTYKLDETGLSAKQMTVIREIMQKPSGMILICGPTGSGKTTSLYALLNEIDRLTRNVITVEDPIEAVLPHTSQIEINPKAEITFAKALRSILRQDPDVICVGEIRDEETAEIALRAAQTGHLVVATMHCDSNAAAVVRLLDLRISPLLISSGLSLLLSQRLVRCLCEQCRRPAKFSRNQIVDLAKSQIDARSLYEAVGCQQCDGTGYHGRTAIADVTVIDDHFRNGIAQNTSALAEELRSHGNQRGRSSLHKQGLRKVVEGITSLQELKRVVG
jgi:type II secretory ATPase GspE/PulE/Tfp pilus assembly ATPase PilB-like protein